MFYVKLKLFQFVGFRCILMPIMVKHTTWNDIGIGEVQQPLFFKTFLHFVFKTMTSKQVLDNMLMTDSAPAFVVDWQKLINCTTISLYAIYPWRLRSLPVYKTSTY